MSMPLFTRCPLCEGTGCRRCDRLGFVPTGLTIGQVDKLVEAAQRLEIRVGDIVIPTNFEPAQDFLFIVTAIDGDRLWGATDTAGSGRFYASAKHCRRVGRIDRKEGQPC